MIEPNEKDIARAQAWLTERGIHANVENTSSFSDPCNHDVSLSKFFAHARLVERRQTISAIVQWLLEWASEAETVPGPPQYEDALNDVADSLASGRWGDAIDRGTTDVVIEGDGP